MKSFLVLACEFPFEIWVGFSNKFECQEKKQTKITNVTAESYSCNTKKDYICNMKDRLIKVLNHFGLTATRLADEIGVQRSGISHILSGRNQPGYDFMVKLLTRFPDINAEWLLLGKGNLLKDKEPVAGSKPVKDLIADNIRQPDLFSTTQTREEDAATYITRNPKVTNVTLIHRVLLLHHDGTFEVYQQSDKD